MHWIPRESSGTGKADPFPAAMTAANCRAAREVVKGVGVMRPR
jgi:hypothetical protein